MTPSTVPSASAGSPHHSGNIEGYYRLHARIYDATRWSFLFGRNTILDRIARVQPAPRRILEVGCGTGRNLLALARRFPRAQLTGVDLSSAMLGIAEHKVAPYGSRVNLVQRAYGPASPGSGEYDLVLCSYSLSMFNPGFAEAITAAKHDLSPQGHFALVDFHASPLRWFSRWMGVNHVRMDGHLRPLLQANFEPATDELHAAYGGVWQYLLFVGRRRA